MKFENIVLSQIINDRIIYKRYLLDQKIRELISIELKIESNEIIERRKFKYNENSFIANFKQDINVYKIT